MSRYRTSTVCKCGWNLGGDLPFGDASLMTEEQYIEEIDWEDCPYSPHGYGFRDDLVGPTYWWHGPNHSGASYPVPGHTRELLVEYLPVPGSDHYRYAKIECPICLRLYVGWYVHAPWTRYKDGTEDRWYEFYDTSFYWAFNDEPDERDVENLRELTADEIKAALSDWVEKRRVK